MMMRKKRKDEPSIIEEEKSSDEQLIEIRAQAIYDLKQNNYKVTEIANVFGITPKKSL